MKRKFTSSAKTEREINVTPLDNCEFVIYDDKITTTFNDDTENSITTTVKGIARYNDIVKYSNTLDAIPQRIPVSKMYGGYGHIAKIKIDNLNKVLTGEMHITDAVEGITVKGFFLDGYRPIIWNPASYKIMNLKYEFISLPYKFDYTYGFVTNERYDLEKLLEILKNDEHVLKRESLVIKNIPYYNASEESNRYIEFTYLLSDEDYNAMYKMSSDDVRNEILTRVAKDCRIN